MHQKSLTLFQAINLAIEHKNTDPLKIIVTDTSIAPWILNEDNQSALEYALEKNSTDSVNIFLDKLFTDAYIDLRTTEAQHAFHYAILKVTKQLCQAMNSWEELAVFHAKPEVKFPFLSETNKDWISWGKDITTKLTSAQSAVTELTSTKPKIQRYIRAIAMGRGMKAFFKKINTLSPTEMLKKFSNEIVFWSEKKIFTDHSNWFYSWSYQPTHTIDTLKKLKEAIEYLIAHPNLKNDKTTEETAINIMLLCAKSYPFDQTEFKSYWKNIAFILLEKFHTSPAITHKLYEPLFDNQWLFTGDHIPFEHVNLIQQLTKEHIGHYLRGYQQDSLALKVEDKKSLILDSNLGEGKQLLALFPVSNPLKCFYIDAPLDKTGADYFHTLLMNNINLSISFSTTDLLSANPLKSFPYAPHNVFIDIADETQFAHLLSQAEILSHTFANIGFAIPKHLLLSQGKLTVFHDIQKLLGRKQTITLLILDNLTNRRIEADFTISSNEIGLGREMIARTAQNEMLFNTIYQQFNWGMGSTLDTVELQLGVIELHLKNKHPLMFVFDVKYYDPRLFEELQSMLASHNPNQIKNKHSCMIRFDNFDKTATKEEPLITDCDFVVTETVVKGGPLCVAQLCNHPEMYISATVKVVRKSVQPPSEQENTINIQALYDREDTNHTPRLN